MIIHNYKVRTGHMVSMAELEIGYLKGRLRPEDYDIRQRVSNRSANLSARLSIEIAPKGPL